MRHHISSCQVTQPSIPGIDRQPCSFRILRLKQVLIRVGISRAQLYLLMGEGRFPKNFSLSGPGGRAVGWLESDIEDWIASRAQQIKAEAQ